MVGGGGIIRREQGREEAIWSVPEGRWTSSHRAEQVALLAAIENAKWTLKEVKTIRICTDPPSLVMFLRSGAGTPCSETQTKIWDGLNEITQQRRKAQVVWIPGHANISGNEQADEAANVGLLPQQDAKIDLPSAKVSIL